MGSGGIRGAAGPLRRDYKTHSKCSKCAADRCGKRFRIGEHGRADFLTWWRRRRRSCQPLWLREARGCRQRRSSPGRRTGDITRLLRIPTYAGDGAQRTGQTSTDELPGTSGDHRELKDPHWPTQPAGWDVLACRDDPGPGSGGMSKLLGCPTDPLEHLRPDGISKAPVGHPRSFVF